MPNQGQGKMMSDEFMLCEGLLWEPSSGYFLLEGHLQRLQRSASHFHFALNVDAVRQQLCDYEQSLPQRPRKVRLGLTANGAVTLEDVDVKPSTPVLTELSEEPIQSGDEFLRHKTTRRAVYDRALAAHPKAQDVLLWNERHELTETCTANIVLQIGGRRLTPPVSSGLLPGVFRALLLDRGEIQEEILPLGALEQATAIFLINSVRRWCEIRLRDQSISSRPDPQPRSGDTRHGIAAK